MRLTVKGMINYADVYENVGLKVENVVRKWDFK
jgi:hypothetical protein